MIDYDNMQKLYLELIVAANDNAEKLDRMTARCKAAEEVIDVAFPYLDMGESRVREKYNLWLTLKKEAGNGI